MRTIARHSDPYPRWEVVIWRLSVPPPCFAQRDPELMSAGQPGSLQARSGRFDTLEPLRCCLAVALLDLYPDRSASELFRCNERASCTSEGVEHAPIVGSVAPNQVAE